MVKITIRNKTVYKNDENGWTIFIPQRGKKRTKIPKDHIIIFKGDPTWVFEIDGTKDDLQDP